MRISINRSFNSLIHKSINHSSKSSLFPQYIYMYIYIYIYILIQ